MKIRSEIDAKTVIGFDGKRAAQNRTGLGNYSRFVLRGLSRFSRAGRLVLYVPSLGKATCLEGVDEERAVELKEPRRGIWRWLRSLWRVWGVTSELEGDGIRLFHGLSGELPLNICKARNVRRIVTIHDLIFLRYPEFYKPIDRWIYRFKFRRACRMADRVIAVSECTKRDIMHYFGTPEEKIKVVYQGCDERFRQPVSEEHNNKVRARYQLPQRFILYVGSIEERKNLLLLAQALPLLEDKEVEVVAVGRRTPYADEVERLVQEQGLSARFRMLQGVTFTDLPAFYQMATVFVYPSRFEGFGIPLLEALCSGTPVIGCTGSCLEEAGGPSSLYVDPDDPQALAAAMHRVLSDGPFRQQMIADGLAYADRFQMETLTRQLLQVYQEVLEK